MRRTMVLVTLLPFISAFLGTFAAYLLTVPPVASAQAATPHEVRANSFVLVGDDGTVQARLSLVPNAGVASLTFLRSDGSPATSFSPSGLTMFGPDGAVTVRVGRCVPSADFPTCAGGLPSFSGIQFGPDGSVSLLPSP
jgi:hypothetical protein